MHNRLDIIQKIHKLLIETGYNVFPAYSIRTIGFDLICKKKDKILIIKILVNIDALKKDVVDDLKLLSKVCEAFPIIIGLKNGSGLLEDDVLYNRHGISIITPFTFYNFIVNDECPIIFAAPGGFYVKLDNELLKKIKKERQISLGTLAKSVGVSRRTIQHYEEGMNATIDIAIRLEEFLEVPLIQSVNPLEQYKQIEKKEIKNVDSFMNEVLSNFLRLDYDVYLTSKCPFEYITERLENIFLTKVSASEEVIKSSAKNIASISKVIEKDSVMIVKTNFKKTNVDGVPLISIEELETSESSRDIFSLIKERKKDA